jgi:putative membrane protein
MMGDMTGLRGIGRLAEGTLMKAWLVGWVGVWGIVTGVGQALAGEVPMPPLEPRIMPPALSWPSLLTSIVYGLLGLILLLIGYYIFEIITPWSVKEELIAHRNPAVAMVVAAFILGMAIVIAAAII